MKKLTIITVGLTALALSGCAVATAGVKKGDERNFVRSVNDVSASRVIKARMVRAADFDLNKVDVEAAEGIVVLSGFAPTPADKAEAERIAWSAPNIRQVGNEIIIGTGQSFVRNSQDGWINRKVKTRLIADRQVKARNINIEAHEGTVYLLGVARTPEELERATHIASTTRGVNEVVSYITLPGDDLVAATSPSTHSIAPQQLQTLPQQALPTQRAIPQGLTPHPVPDTLAQGQHLGQGGLPQAALPPSAPVAELDTDALPDVEPYYVDPKTGKRIELPPGTVTVPYNPRVHGPITGAPHYLDPETGEKIPVIFRRSN